MISYRLQDSDSQGIDLGFYEKLEPAKMTKDRQITILRKYVELLRSKLNDARLSELLAKNELRKDKGLPALAMEVQQEDWIQ
jgi:hypothetical protein